MDTVTIVYAYIVLDLVYFSQRIDQSFRSKLVSLTHPISDIFAQKRILRAHYTKSSFAATALRIALRSHSRCPTKKPPVIHLRRRGRLSLSDS